MREATGSEKSLYDVLEKLARAGREQSRKREEKRILRVKTTFDGTREQPELGGSITNLFSDNFMSEAITFGVLEGMIRELYEMYQVIYRGTKTEIQHMIGSGNGLRKNPVLCEIVEELFGAKLILSDCEEEAATGAAKSSIGLQGIYK